MKTRMSRLFRPRRGSVIVLAVVFLPATLGAMALAIDLAMLIHSRVQAQGAADSAALAGASAFLDFVPAATAVTPAEARARAYAALNDIRGVSIDPDAEVTVEVRPATFEVYVHVRRTEIPTWFARFLGIMEGSVSADAVAQATPAGGVKCLDPLAIPDAYSEGDTDTNGNRVLDLGEEWEFDPTGNDYYNRTDLADPDNNEDGNPDTGFGSAFRNAPDYGTGDGTMYDNGRQMTIKPQDPQESVKPGYFQALSLPNSINTGASGWQENFRNCNPTVINVGDEIPVKTGDMRGPTRQIMEEIFATDPLAYYDAENKRVVSPIYTGDDWINSPRVLLLALFDPNEIELMHGSAYDLHVIDFAYFFLETPPARNADPVIGRFMFYAQGVGGTGPTGQLTRVLRLVE